MRLPILGGRLRGRWWLPASRGKLLRILGGTYEAEQTRLFELRVARGQTVLDVGGHVGYYTLLASVLVGDEGTVWAFEPDPRNAEFLRRHARINGRRNVRVEQAAVSDENGTAHFQFGRGSGTGRLADGGTHTVRTLRLDDFCAEHGIRPSAVKIDVEGAELRVLQGAREVLERDRPLLFLSTHGPEVHRACLQRLRELGYRCEPILGESVETASELLCTPGAEAL